MDRSALDAFPGVCMSIYTYIYIFMYVSVRVCVCVIVCMYVCMHAWMYMCMFGYIVCMYLFMYACTYTRAHVCRSLWLSAPLLFYSFVHARVRARTRMYTRTRTCTERERERHRHASLIDGTPHEPGRHLDTPRDVDFTCGMSWSLPEGS